MAALNNTPHSQILIVDDNGDALSAMSDLLKMRGFSVRTAQNGLEALNRMKADDVYPWEFMCRKKSDPRA